MSTIDGASRPPPTCVQEVGYRGHPKSCGDPARYGLVFGERPGPPIPMCDFHADLATDRAGARIAVEWRAPEATRDTPG